jgi:hypothetical protein
MLPDYFGLYGHHDSWPLPHFLLHPAQTQLGSGACAEITGCDVLIITPVTTTPDNAKTVTSTE